MGSHILTRDFKAAAEQHIGDMAYLRGLVTKLQSGTFLDRIPVYNQGKWSDRMRGNCTAFAFDSPHNGWMQPGFLGTGEIRYNEDRPKRHRDYAADVHLSILRDDVVYMGQDLRSAIRHGIPAAVFYKGLDGDEDYHWYALRRCFNLASDQPDKLVWMNKLGSSISSSSDDETIFDHAQSYGYKVFGGYYAIPLKLIGK